MAALAVGTVGAVALGAVVLARVVPLIVMQLGLAVAPVLLLLHLSAVVSMPPDLDGRGVVEIELVSAGFTQTMMLAITPTTARTTMSIRAFFEPIAVAHVLPCCWQPLVWLTAWTVTCGGG